MIVDKISRYIKDNLVANNLSGILPERSEALRVEVEQLAGHIFTRQFLTAEAEAAKGQIRLSACGRCPRQQAYVYHGFEKAGKELDQRAKTVFFMGDMVELLIIALARLAGCNVVDYGMEQKTVKLTVGGVEIEGHPDGRIIADDGQEFLLECKSASSFAYERFERGDIDESYVAQINAYLEAIGLDNCCLVFINKDSGVMCEKIVKRDPNAMLLIKANLLSVIKSTPEQLPTQPYQPDEKGLLPWQCRYCSYWKTCWPQAEEVLVKKSYKLQVKI